LYAVGGFTGKTFLNSIEFIELGDQNEWTCFVSKDDVTCDDASSFDEVNKVMNGGAAEEVICHSLSKSSLLSDEPLVEVEEESPAGETNSPDQEVD